MSGERFAELAGASLEAFLANATTGIAARCTAINTRRSISLLPTSWTFQAHRRKRTPTLPVCVTSFIRSENKERRRSSAHYLNWYALVLGVGAKHTKQDPATEEDMKQLLETVLREMFDEEERWRGHTLADRVVDAFLDDIEAHTIALPEFNEDRAIYVSGIVRIAVTEEQTCPS